MKTYADKKIINTKLATLSMSDDGIIRLTFDFRNAMTVNDGKEIFTSVMNVSKGDKVVLLLKQANSELASRELRTYFVGEEVTRIVKGAAFLITNPVIRMGVNFFIKLNKPPYPFKMFTSEEQAVKWLKGYLQ